MNADSVGRPRAKGKRPTIAFVDLAAGVTLAVLSALLLGMSYLPHEESLSGSLDSMYWPRLVLWGLLIFSALLASKHFYLRYFEVVAAPEREDAGARAWPLLAIGCCVAYLILVGIAGFLLSTLLFCALFPFLLGLRNWKRLAPFAVGVTAGVWVLVIVIMHVSLPRGIGVFHDISAFLY
jgi:hypothetical protein